MARSTGPILAVGAVTMINASVFHDKPIDWRVPMATGLFAIGMYGMERVWPTGAVLFAWGSLLTVLLTRTDPNIPSPTESLWVWWNQGQGQGQKGVISL